MSIGIWPVVIILVIIALFVLPIIFASKVKRLDQRGYVVRTLPMLVVFGAANFLADSEDLTIAVGAALLSFAGLPFYMIWSVHRTQDAGMSKWLNLLQVIPLIGFILWIVLLSKKTKDSHEDVADVFS